MDFYRQVQAISDTLLSLDFQKEFGTKEVNEKTVKNLVAQENTLEKKITTAKSRLRYLTTLSGKKVEERPTCQICLEVYEIGIISNCGHSFCKECTLIWRKTAANCPFCKAHLRPKDFFQVTYSPKDLAMKKEQAGPKGSIPGGKRIYEDVDDQMLREIKSINLENSYGSKIDMITRHLTWLQRNEPGFKAVVFSQWSDVLEVVKESLSRAEVGFASLEKDGLSKFKHDPDVSCFLLHAKSQSAGLTLVNATHVFLCEPLLNVGLELQAVSRVHRIGQQRATTVWLYVVNNTVEQSVLELATRRRMAFIGQNNDEDTPMSDAESSQLLDEKLEAAESDELREGLGKLIEKSPGGGELVDTKDLWDCLFTRTDAGSGAPKVNHLLVRRELALNAAEQRLARPGLVEVEKAPGR